MDFKAFKEVVIAAAKAAGLTDYELYYEQSESTSISVFQHEINQFSSDTSGGVCFRAVVGGKMGYASTEELSEASAKSIVARAMENAATLESEEPVFLCEGGKTYEKLELDPAPIPATDKLVAAALDAQEKLYAADKRVIDGSRSGVGASTVSVAIVNSKGLDLSYENASCRIFSMAIVDGNGEKSNGMGSKSGKLEEIDVNEVVGKAASTAVAKLGGEVAPTAVCPVVFDPDAMASLLATFSGIFSSENAQKGLSRFAGKEGEIVAAPCVTLVDDPFCKDGGMMINFDDEGSPAHKKNVIEGGKLTTLLYNLKTAAVAGRETTGNASKADYAAPVGIRPFSFYFAPGSMTEDELLAKAGNGVYINMLGGLHAGANPTTGDFSLQSAGFLIENGKKTKPVKSFTVAGNFYELLGKIVALSDKLEFSAGRGGSGTTSFGAPCVLIDQLSIAGK